MVPLVSLVTLKLGLKTESQGEADLFYNQGDLFLVC